MGSGSNYAHLGTPPVQIAVKAVFKKPQSGLGASSKLRTMLGTLAAKQPPTAF
jgi:hypothetical protein